MRSYRDQRIFETRFEVAIENISNSDLRNLIQALKRESKRRKELKKDSDI